MKKKYLVEFTTVEGAVYEYEFTTSNLKKAIMEYEQGKAIKEHRVVNEEPTTGTKSLLLG